MTKEDVWALLFIGVILTIGVIIGYMAGLGALK